jgi:hypothetical protein
MRVASFSLSGRFCHAAAAAAAAALSCPSLAPPNELVCYSHAHTHHTSTTPTTTTKRRKRARALVCLCFLLPRQRRSCGSVVGGAPRACARQLPAPPLCVKKSGREEEGRGLGKPPAPPRPALWTPNRRPQVAPFVPAAQDPGRSKEDRGSKGQGEKRAGADAVAPPSAPPPAPAFDGPHCAATQATRWGAAARALSAPQGACQV